MEKAKICLVYTHTSPKGPTWPNIGYDYESRKKELTEKLRQACPGIEFLPFTAQSIDEGKKVLEQNSDVDGYVVYMVGIWNGVPRLFVETKKPTVLVDDLFAGSGEFLITYSWARSAIQNEKDPKNRLKVTGVSSSRFDDVVEAVRCFECLKKLKQSTILVVGNKADMGIQERYGTKVQEITFQQLNDAYNKADRNEAKKWAKQWISKAKKVIEPTAQEIEKSGAMYLAMLDLMKQYNAQAITINCLGGFYGGHITAYPCLGFMQLDNDGLVGACESDQRSTITKLIMDYLVERPGFISDPVIDTSKNQIIYAHCVASTKVYGSKGPSNPYYIRNHSEDRKGAVVRSLMPLGEMTTTVEFDHYKWQVLFHQGKTVANVDEDKACRTKLAAEVKGDINKLFNYWDTWSWHRVTYFGDFKQRIRHISALLGYEVVEEA